MDIENLGQKVAQLKWREGYTWTQIDKEFPDVSRDTFRRAARRYRDAHPDEFPEAGAPEVSGVTAAEAQPNPEDAYKRMVEDWDLLRRFEERKRGQSLKFAQSIVCLVNSADWHLGGQGVDYPALRADLELIADTPGMYVVTLGDLVDNFILAKMASIRYGTTTPIPAEWAVVRMLLEIVSDKMLISVGGNHDKWTKALAGIDYFADVVRSVTDKALYDPDEVYARLTIGSWDGILLKARHKWRGNSELNISHGPEKAARFDKPFHIGMAAHTHVSGVVRQFRTIDPETQRPDTGIILQAGSYKRYDDYAKALGLPEANTSTSVAVIIDSRTRSLIGFDNLRCAANWMGEL